jgi:phage FluMu protein gp41
MKFQVMMSVVIEARTPQEAQEHAVKLKELVKNPLARMAIEAEGVKFVNGGEPVVYKPQQIA